MAPAQPLATGDEEAKLKMVVKSEEVNGDSNEKLVCESNFEDSGFYGDSLAVRDKSEASGLDQEVDVVGVGEEGGGVMGLDKNGDPDPDATEQSSSFGNTFSGSEDEARMSSSDMEVDSQFMHTPTSQFAHTQFMGADNREPSVLDGFGRIRKKKKVTAHWRRFISPLMWRCQWLELRMNELHSQVLLYDKELAAYKREKQLQSKMIELDGSVSRLVPLSCKRHSKRAMKRMKRKRIEDTADIPSYMSNHSIFSYYENKRAETDCQSVDNDCGHRGDEAAKRNEDYEWLLLGLNDGDDSLEKVLHNLDNIQSKVLSLKTELSKVMSRNSREIYPRARSLSCSPVNNGDTMPQNNISDCELELPESVVSSYGDAADVDMIQCTVGLLSADTSLRHHPMRNLYKDI
ncbi:uncharacterized protein A4U43_C09F4270 [Asparagus officinalis]|uniref:Uncharacterized protein n=1 Tax=Asparagus officinalis TaxID=4686 RepID=A0A5P1E8I7_ASPOF|nr:uncharacterized protein A4U43_C09F4270 [Asparagus officinalis]